jgi:cytochrome c-type biogenesis protein CcmH/NrfG
MILRRIPDPLRRSPVKRSIALFTLCAVACLTSASFADPPAGSLAAAKPAPEKPAANAAKPMPAVTDSLGLLERAVAKDSTKFDNLYRLGVMYLDRDRSAEAARVLAKASSLRPKDLRTLVNLGAAEDALGNPKVAQDYYKRALVVSPEDSVATCRLASSLYAQSSYNEAIDLLRSVIRKRPSAYCAYFTLGVAFADAGIYRDAIRMWRKVVQLAPGSPEAVSAVESIEVLEKFVAK